MRRCFSGDIQSYFVNSAADPTQEVKVSIAEGTVSEKLNFGFPFRPQFFLSGGSITLTD
jgi:hypothetical protein